MPGADTEDTNVKKFSIGVLGAGTWGMALARMLTVSGNDVQVWSAIEAEVDNLSTTRVHPNLPGMVIPQELRFTKSIEEVCTGKDVLLFAVPSVFVRATAAKARPYIRSGQIIVDVAKGIEPDTLYTMTEILADELSHENGPRAVRLVALSGPTHAEEVALDLPTTIVSASPDLEAAEVVQEVFSNTCMRVYTNTDIKGVELSGAMKNVIALGVGISTGLGYGDNARAALITRGIAEIARLGVAMGCNVQTFAGLAGIGDLIVTATSMHSRNKTALQNVTEGLIVARKLPKEQADEIGMKMLAKVGLADRADYYPRQLSGGQQQRVAIARALAADPEIIYFDEPTSALDPELTGEVLSVMRQLAEEGMTMLVVTHEMGFARNVSSKTVFMENGMVVEQAPSQQFFASPKEERTRAFLRRIAHTE